MTASEIMSSSLLPRSVRRALGAMRANVGRDWRLAELARIAGVSGRTLQRQFLRFLGKSPVSVLRDIGFARARRALLRASAGTRITDVALACGFPHCGRFSVDYRTRYGETPSQTLKRQLRFSAASAAVSPFCTSPRDQPTIAFAGILTDAGEGTADDLAHELEMALTRSGTSVTAQPANARYHLVGAIRGEGDEQRLLLRLFDRDTGRQLWAQRCDGIVGDEIAADGDFATRIVAALQPQLRRAEIDRALQAPGTDLGAQGLALRAMPGVLALDAEGNDRALELLARAMDLDPGHALATALAAWAHVQRIVYHFSSDPRADRARGLELARKAGTLGGDAIVLAVLGNALTLLDELDDADAVIRKALRSTAARPGPGAAAAGSTSIAAIRHRRSSALRSRSTSRRTIRWPSTAWSEWAAPISTPANTRRPPTGRRAHSPNTPPRSGPTARCVRPTCSAAPDPRPTAACMRCASVIRT